jgi:hypothetical protein
MSDKELIRFTIECESDRLCDKAGEMYYTHLCTHDRWRDHLNGCRTCKKHLLIAVGKIMSQYGLDKLALEIAREQQN